MASLRAQTPLPPSSRHPNEQQTHLERFQNPFVWHTLHNGSKAPVHPQPGYREDLGPARYVHACTGKPFPTAAEYNPPEVEQRRVYAPAGFLETSSRPSALIWSPSQAALCRCMKTQPSEQIQVWIAWYTVRFILCRDSDTGNQARLWCTRHNLPLTMSLNLSSHLPLYRPWKDITSVPYQNIHR